MIGLFQTPIGADERISRRTPQVSGQANAIAKMKSAAVLADKTLLRLILPTR